MQLINDVFTAIIGGYLAFTGLLADTIARYVPAPETTTEVSFQETSPIESNYSVAQRLPGIFENKKWSDILLRSTRYQSAAANSALEASDTVTDPSAALVNIFCTFVTDTTIRTTTGTGFFVHSDGVIMTNAHVAQYLLLGETTALGEAECIVRQGTPATPKYIAKLLYIPPAWVQENAASIDAAIPTGTGERDYALLYVSESLDTGVLPETFPALPLYTDLLSQRVINDNVVVAGYPATSLQRNGGNGDLLGVVATTTVSELYTFGSNYADVIAIRGTNVGAEGSSGGPVLNEDGAVIGMIATRGDDSTDGAGSLRAITLSHVQRTILEETGFSLERNISGDLPFRGQVFTDTVAPLLTSLLEDELSN